ncbi:carotenoid cleavage dioxygenase 7 [Cucumis melo var. makuwa]|uniref:Carotenoid cleavage dioxygenase 7 n=2 Tax=Cucumis melo TaxID=3656 RepID=A0A5A7T9T6_CUCMM|nr:carotenoid cleavage dioxygenase 7 [Cucumis melo var. makuwa]TYK24704.1 carotenoid cleavage dioxygenase 7 [Cucumis melo var. makuwa]
MAKKMMGVSLLICIVVMAALEFSIANGEEKKDEYESKFDARYRSCYESCEKECLKNSNNGKSFCEVKCDEDCDEKEVADKLHVELN